MLGRRGFSMIAAAVVVVGAGSLIGVELTRPTEPAPTTSGTGLNEVWSTAFPAGATTSTGDWVNGDQIVAGYDTAVTAYNLGTGRIEWTWKPPAGQQVEELSQSTENGTGVLIYGSPAASDATNASWTMAAIDLATGSPLWTMDHVSPDVATEPLLVDNGRIATVSSGSLDESPATETLSVFDLATGATEWTASSTSGATTSCGVRSAAFVGRFLYAEAYCGGTDTKVGVAKVFALAPDSGAQLAGPFVVRCPDQNQVVDPVVWSAAGHLVVDCQLPGGAKAPSVWVSAAGARALTPADPKIATNVVDFGFDHGAPPAGVAAFGDTMALAGFGATTVQAVDLTSGRVLWNQLLPLGYSGWALAANSNGTDIAVDNGNFLSVVRYSPTGVESPGPGFPLPGLPAAGQQPTPTVPAADNGRFVLDGNRLVVLGFAPGDAFTLASAVTVFSTGSWTG